MPISFFFVLIFGVLWFLFTRHAIIFGSDEFAWGQFTKVVFSANGLYTANSAIMDGKLNYPPGMSLFQYYFLNFGRYSEAAIFFSQGIFLFIAIAPIFDFVGRNLKKALLFALAIAMALVYFGPGLLSMTNDHIIGSAFAVSILANYFILRSTKSKLLLLPVIFALPVIKTTGIILSLTIVLSVATEVLTAGMRSDIKVKTVLLKSGGMLILFLFFAFLPIKSWDYYIKGQGMEATSMPGPAMILKSFSSAATEREKIVVKNFNNALIRRPINTQEGDIKSNLPLFRAYLKVIEAVNRPALSTLSWLSITVILFALIIFGQKPNAKAVASSRFFTLIIGLFVYLFFHMLAYMYYFSEYEAINLLSMDRYISSYFLGLVLIIIGSSAVLIEENPRQAKPFIWVSATIMAYLLIFHTPTLAKLIVPPSMMAKSTEAVRETTRPFSNYINANTEEDSKVWVIYQNTKGWECMMIRYDIVPRRMNGGSGNWSLGEKYGPKDVWTNPLPPDRWSFQLLDGKYNYVFLASADNNFWNHYSGLFTDPVVAKSRQLFRVEQRGNDTLLVAK